MKRKVISLLFWWFIAFSARYTHTPAITQGPFDSKFQCEGTRRMLMSDYDTTPCWDDGRK